MVILAADTSTEILSLAVCEWQESQSQSDESQGFFENITLLGEVTLRCHRAHTEKMLTVLDGLLKEVACPVSRVDLLAVSIGPGSFTGLRVGLAAWKGIAAALHLPLVGVPTLDAMTRLSAFWNGCICPLLDARMNEVFAAVYEFREGCRTKRTADKVCSIEALSNEIPGDVEPLVFLGNGLALYGDYLRRRFPRAQFVPYELGVPRGLAVAREAVRYCAASTVGDATFLAPIYLRKSQAEELKEHRSS